MANNSPVGCAFWGPDTKVGSLCILSFLCRFSSSYTTKTYQGFNFLYQHFPCAAYFTHYNIIQKCLCQGLYYCTLVDTCNFTIDWQIEVEYTHCIYLLVWLCYHDTPLDRLEADPIYSNRAIIQIEYCYTIKLGSKQ